MPNPTATDSPKPPRRRLTPEQRIAERQAEIAAIKAHQRERVKAMIVKARELLDAASIAAESAGLPDDFNRCRAAILGLDDPKEPLL